MTSLEKKLRVVVAVILKLFARDTVQCTSLYTKTLSKRFMHVRLQIY